VHMDVLLRIGDGAPGSFQSFLHSAGDLEPDIPVVVHCTPRTNHQVHRGIGEFGMTMWMLSGVFKEVEKRPMDSTFPGFSGPIRPAYAPR